MCVCGTPFLLVGSVQFSPDSRRLSTNQKRVKGKEPNGVARLGPCLCCIGSSSSVSSSPSVVVVTGDGCYAYKNVSTTTWYSHIHPLLHGESLGRLCARTLADVGSRPKVLRSRASSHLNTTLRPIFFLQLSHTSICLFPPERSFIPVPSSVPPGHIFTKSNC